MLTYQVDPAPPEKVWQMADLALLDPMQVFKFSMMRFANWKQVILRVTAAEATRDDVMHL